MFCSRRPIVASLVLTEEALFLVGSEEDFQLQAYPLVELRCWPDVGDTNIMYIALKDLSSHSHKAVSFMKCYQFLNFK